GIGDIKDHHKRTLTDESYTELLELRSQLQALLVKKHYRQLQRSKALYYIHANKGGRFLARMLRGHTNACASTQAKTNRWKNDSAPRNDSECVPNILHPTVQPARTAFYDPNTHQEKGNPTIPDTTPRQTHNSRRS
ncbi:Hypothetical predicted protein, partial [Pelobates cultripes]